MRKWLVVILLICINSCQSLDSFVTVTDQEKTLNKASNQEITIRYIGCGGYLLQQKNSSILIDPFFSNVPLLQIHWKKMQTQQSLINRFFHESFKDSVDQQGKVKAILVGHSHYDHLADIPNIWKNNCTSKPTIIGGTTTHHLLQKINIPSLNISDTTSKIIIDNIHIYPIVSTHAPHLKTGKFSFLKRNVKQKKPFPQIPFRFPEGEVYNFLIDYLDENQQIQFRIFSHASAASSAPIGFPPKELLKTKKIDVILLAVANYNQVENYPLGLLKHIGEQNIQHVILGHWENFFKPLQPDQIPSKVPMTNVKKFLQIMDSTHIPYTLPKPFINLTFKY